MSLRIKRDRGDDNRYQWTKRKYREKRLRALLLLSYNNISIKFCNFVILSKLQLMELFKSPFNQSCFTIKVD